MPIIGSLRDASAIAAEYRIDYAVIAMPGMPSAKLASHLRVWSAVFSNILIIPDLFGITSLWIETRDLGGVLGLEIRHNLLKPVNRWIKRAVDIFVSALGLILIAPFIPIVALWIRLSSPGPALFVQEREGEGGQADPHSQIPHHVYKCGRNAGTPPRRKPRRPCRVGTSSAS